MGRVRTFPVKPHRREIDERMPFCLRGPGPCDRVGRTPCSFNEVCDLRFDINVEVEEAGAERGVLRHHHQRDDFLTLDDVKVEVVLLPYYLLPLPAFRVAHFGGRHEEKRPQVGKVFLGALCVVRNFLKRWCDRGGESLAEILRRQACRCVGVKAEILFALVRDEFGPALLAEHDGQPLKTHPFLLGDELIESAFDLGPQDGHSETALSIGAS